METILLFVFLSPSVSKNDLFQNLFCPKLGNMKALNDYSCGLDTTFFGGEGGGNLFA